jgi:hypothetical protein
VLLVLAMHHGQGQGGRVGWRDEHRQGGNADTRSAGREGTRSRGREVSGGKREEGASGRREEVVVGGPLGVDKLEWEGYGVKKREGRAKI